MKAKEVLNRFLHVYVIIMSTFGTFFLTYFTMFMPLERNLLYNTYEFCVKMKTTNKRCYQLSLIFKLGWWNVGCFWPYMDVWDQT